MNINEDISMVVFASLLKGGDRWHSPFPNWQEKYHLYTTYILTQPMDPEKKMKSIFPTQYVIPIKVWPLAE